MLDIVRQKRPAMIDGVLQDLSVMRFTEPFRHGGHDVKTAFPEHFGQQRADVLVEQETNLGHRTGPFSP